MITTGVPPKHYLPAHSTPHCRRNAERSQLTIFTRKGTRTNIKECDVQGIVRNRLRSSFGQPTLTPAAETSIRHVTVVKQGARHSNCGSRVLAGSRLSHSPRANSKPPQELLHWHCETFTCDKLLQHSAASSWQLNTSPAATTRFL